MKKHTLLATVAAAAALLAAAPAAFADDMIYAAPGITEFSTMISTNGSVWVGNADKRVFANDWQIWRSSDGSQNYGITQTEEWKNIRVSDLAEHCGRLRVESGLYHAMNDIIVGGGTNSEAHLMVSGGRMESAWWMNVGNGFGAVTTVEVNTNGVLYVGTDDGSGIGSTAQLAIGENSTSSLTVKDSGAFQCNSLTLAMGEGSTTTCTVSGGTLTAAYITKGAGTATLNLNGGTLVASAGGTFIADGISCVVQGDVGISTESVVEIVPAFTGSGTVVVDVQSGSGSVTMPKPATGVTVEPGDTTKMEEVGGNLVFTYALFVWENVENPPSEGDNVIIPEGVSITNNSTLALGSLRINGSLTLGENSSLTVKSIRSETGAGVLNLNWGTLTADAAGEFISDGVECIVGGEPKISSAYPITIAPTFSAPEGGTVKVEVTGDDGCVIMHTPSSNTLTLQRDSGTQVRERNGWTSFYSPSDAIFIWDNSDVTPTNNATAVIPAGYEIDFAPTTTNRLASLRIDGKLTVSQLNNTKYLLLAGKAGFTVTGTGTLALPLSASYMYSETVVNTEETLTLLIHRSIAEAKSISDDETLLRIAAGSQIKGPVKLANSRRPLVVANSSSYTEYKAGAIPPSWTQYVEKTGQIVWDDAKNITGDSAADISQEGVFVNGFFHNYSTERGFNGATYTIEGITLRRLFGSGDASSLIGFSQISGSTTNSYDLFGARKDDIRQSGMDLSCLVNASDGYKHILRGGIRCNWGNYGGYLDITIGGLTAGHAYLVQLFCMDPTKTAEGEARMYVGDLSSTEYVEGKDKLVKTNINAANGTAGPGQYIIGRFVAAGDTQTFRIKGGSGYGRENAILWRDITADVVWGGGESGLDGSWDKTGNNWATYAAEDQIWKNNVIGYVYGAVVNTNANVTVSDEVYAASLDLSGDAKVTVAKGATLNINNDIAATTNATFTVQSGGSVNLRNGSLRMSGYGNFTVNAPSLTKVVIDAGQLTRTDSAGSTDLEFSGTALYGDETAKEKGYHALYSATGDIILSALSGNGNITAEHGSLTIDDSEDHVFTGHIKAKSMVKQGGGTFKVIGESEVSHVTVSNGTLALATPADLNGFIYDFDASRTDTIDSTSGSVTKWRDAYGSETYFLTPAGDDVYIEDDNYIAPVLEENVFGDMPGLVSDSFRMDGSATEYQSSLFAVMKLTGDEVGSPRLLVDKSDANASSTHYRLRISITDGKPAYYDIVENYSASASAWIAVNGEYGASFSTNEATLISVPWHWMRIGNNSNNGLRIPTYGWGAPMAWGEIVSYNRELSIEEKKAVEEFLMRKWGIGEKRTYAPFGTGAELTIAKNGVFNAGGQAMTVGKITVYGHIVEPSGITTPSIEFKSGSRIYVNRSDIANGLMTVTEAEGLVGAGNVSIHFSDTGDHASGYTLERDSDTGVLKLIKAGFSVRIR